MEQNKDMLDMMRKYGGNLRMWSQFRKKKLSNNTNFICDVCHEGLADGVAQKHLEQKNENENRFNCFLCDYDVCKECIMRRTKGGTMTQDPMALSNGMAEHYSLQYQGWV